MIRFEDVNILDERKMKEIMREINERIYDGTKLSVIVNDMRICIHMENGDGVELIHEPLQVKFNLKHVTVTNIKKKNLRSIVMFYQNDFVHSITFLCNENIKYEVEI